MRAFADTIVAPITGPPPAAVAVVRLSGPDAFRIASDVFSPWPETPELRRAVYGRLVHGDDGLALPFPSGHGYTGEETVELSIHGSRASIDALVEACIRAGARRSAPGEFTMRAFLNGRIDLTQAEAVRETIESETDAQLRAANQNRDGALRRRVEAVREVVLHAVATIEASVDFSDEVGDLDRPALTASLGEAVRLLDEIAERASSTRLARLGLRVAIVGPPNAGKSSLMNALLGQDRSIVTHLPGTTRDFLEETASFLGVKVVLIDTAGLRETEDLVEAIGVQRSRAAAAAADEIWYVYDATSGWTSDDEASRMALGPRVRVLANKADLAIGPIGQPVSALTGQGLDELVREIAAQAPESIAYYLNERQAPLILSGLSSVAEAIERTKADDPPDLVAVLLRDALHSLNEVLGEAASPDVLEQIFSRFCIGK